MFNDCFFVGFLFIFWREVWKYGERVFRYCNYDVGYVIVVVVMVVVGLGWDVKLFDGLGYNDLERLMGFEFFFKLKISSRFVKGKFFEIEFEYLDCVLVVFLCGEDNIDVDFMNLSSVILGFSKLDWKGKFNLFSKEYIIWDVIYRIVEVVKKLLFVGKRLRIVSISCSGVYSESLYKGLIVREVVRLRRSVVDMDGVIVIYRDIFY